MAVVPALWSLDRGHGRLLLESALGGRALSLDSGRGGLRLRTVRFVSDTLSSHRGPAGCEHALAVYAGRFRRSQAPQRGRCGHCRCCRLLVVLLFFRIGATEALRLFAAPIQMQPKPIDLVGFLVPKVMVNRTAVLASLYHIPIAPLRDRLGDDGQITSLRGHGDR